MASQTDIAAKIDHAGPKLLEILDCSPMFCKQLEKFGVILHMTSQDFLVQGKNKSTVNWDLISLVRTFTPTQYEGFLKALKLTKQEEAIRVLSGNPLSKERTPEEFLEDALRELKDSYKRQFKLISCIEDNGETGYDITTDYIQTSLRELSRKANESPGNGNGKELAVDDLFKQHKKILIQGKSGIGKTTFVQKLTYDWACGQGQQYIRDLKLFILCRVNEIEEGMDIETAISNALKLEQGKESTLFDFYREHMELCVVVFEGINEASAEIQNEVNTYVKTAMSNRHVIVTRRQGSEQGDLTHFDVILEMDGFSEKQMMSYFKNTFPNLVDEIKHLLDNTSITLEFLKSPYNCQALGKLLHSGENYEEGSFTLTKLMEHLVSVKLDFHQIERDDQSFVGLTQLALHYTLNKKPPLRQKDLDEYQITKEGIKSKFFQKVCCSPPKWVFPDDMMREYLAAVALFGIEVNKTHYYRKLCSNEECFDVIRHICGMLSDKEEFKNIIGHIILLSEVDQLSFAYKNDILKISENIINGVQNSNRNCSIFGYLRQSVSTCSVFMKEFMYEWKGNRLVNGKLKDAEKLIFLGGQTERSSVPESVLSLLIQCYYCFHDLTLQEKDDCNIVKEMIGKGITGEIKNTRVSHVIPVGKAKDRLAQITITKKSKTAWITAHTVTDVKECLVKIADETQRVFNLVLCIPGRFQRRVWGRSPIDRLTEIQDELEKFKLKTLQLRVESPDSLIDSLPDKLQATRMVLLSYNAHTAEEWRKFLKYIVTRPIECLCIGFILLTLNLSDDGLLEAFQDSSLISSEVKEFKVLDFSINVYDVLDFLEKRSLKDVPFGFTRTRITGIDSLEVLERLFEVSRSSATSGPHALWGVSLEASKEVDFDPESCSRVLHLDWSKTSATDDTTELYVNIVNAAENVQTGKYFLPIDITGSSCSENQKKCFDAARERCEQVWQKKIDGIEETADQTPFHKASFEINEL